MLDQEIIAIFNIQNIVSVKSLSTGLINNSFAIECDNGNSVLLQQVNTSIFLHPEDIQSNYQKISEHLRHKNSYQLPKIIQTIHGEHLFTHEKKVWRCFEFFADTYSPLTAHTPEEAYIVAKCFGKFSADLSSMDAKNIKYILPGFHNLSIRFQQFESALQNTSKQLRNDAANLINLTYENSRYVKLFEYFSENHQKFPLHILHQDCKIANILFWKDNPNKICPIDLDTTQPGLFFSDMGDMIRSMVPSISENDTAIDSMELRTEYYEAIKKGYLESMKNHLTIDEKKNIDSSGNIIIYMQAIRFLTDYLNGDIYYKTSYPQQNKDRAANQFKLLELLHYYQDSKVPVDTTH